jgi:uncharacterized membrane protein (GlpM family)
MLSDSLLLHLALAFAIGSVWVALVTVIAERAGSTVGGIVGGLPSTSAFSFFFIGINQSSDAAVQATTVFPLAFSFTCAFLLFYVFFAKKGFRVGLSVSLLIWFAVSALIAISNLKNFALSLVGGVLISAAIYYLFAERLNLKNFPSEKMHYTTLQLLGRGAFAGFLVLVAVLASQIGGSIVGGIFSAFPAVFTSTLYIINKSKGIDFSRSVAKPLAMCSILTVIPYGVAVRYLYPSLGIWIGTVISYAIVAPLAFLAYRLVERKRDR